MFYNRLSQGHQCPTGDQCQKRTREMGSLNSRCAGNGPALPGVQSDSLSLILKRVFGRTTHCVNGRKRSPKVLVQIGFQKQRMWFGLLTLDSSAGVLNMNSVISLQVHDMFDTDDKAFGSKMQEHDHPSGFGAMKRQKLDHCGRQHEKHSIGEITISKKSYNQNLTKASLTLERTKQLDDEHSAMVTS